MTTFGLGFSQQEVNRKCRTVLYRDRYKNSKFKSLGNNVMRRMKVVRSMENMDLADTQDTPDTGAKAVTIIIGGRGSKVCIGVVLKGVTNAVLWSKYEQFMQCEAATIFIAYSDGRVCHTT